MARRVGLIPGPVEPGPGPSSIGQMIRVLDSMRARFATPIETQPVSGTGHSVLREFSGLLLGSTFSAASWIHDISLEAESRLALASPFVLSGSGQCSVMVWPFEDATRLRTGGGLLESWVETTSMSRASVEASARRAAMLARERSLPLFWISGGWGGQEEFAYAHAQGVVGMPMPLLPLEQLQDSLVEPLKGKAAILLSVGRTAIPVARGLGAQGWIAWAERGPALAQAWGRVGPALSISLFLDHLGFPTEARKLEAAACESVLAGATDLIASTVERILNG